jgi:chromosome partitioning protein
MSRENILRKALEPIKDTYDFIIIDCPPSLGLLTINAHVAADKIFIPVQAEYFALEGLGQLVNTIKLVKSNLNNELEIGGVIITMFDSRTNLSKDVALELQKFFEDKLFDTLIPRNIRLSEAPSHGLSIQEYDATSNGAKAYERLTNEILERFGSKNKGLERPRLGKA